ncbi:FAD:protein FMN transferase [Ancylomarina euxinus]|uniref:FAD:protein FMN transferase n=1 Tax=Ancylomarina euxinus TaxID=2283627 RepID=A0A425XXX2_9BACT|nr:FAD:protein FMN transferase [Ancylomarina euxinus]MCZ4695867.1 FAD:protein FMN transferase [Ancylomarina euxinus]MUP16242.1 FAD:protein FMN transferase [Ancylomarina euxinus]RRG19612.1 FAD:protein FMN transferase [Ancylomarina euxinus]
MIKRIQLLVLTALVLFACQPTKKDYQYNEGYIWGTIYHIIYNNPKNVDFHDEIKAKMNEFDLSLSTYKPNSTISRVNNNDSTVVLDHYFKTVFNRSIQISEVTNGAFDMTIAPLVNAWGFGFKNKLEPEDIPVDSLLQIVGFNKVKLLNNRIIKDDPRIMFDASAIAKGYGVDVVAAFLESKGISNYMVEIGGEIRVKGISNKKRSWRVGIDRPIDDPEVKNREIQDVLSLADGAMATSGNYRQFYIKNGKKYAHTIDPKQGYPVQHSLLSASVIAPDCMTADAYATAFMVLGLEKSITIVENDPNLDAYFIYTDEDGKYQTYSSDKIKEMILK